MRTAGLIRGLMSLCLGACAGGSGSAAGIIPPKHPPPIVQVSTRVEPPVADDRTFVSKFRAQEDAYVVIGHIDGNGQLRILFPEYPDSIGLVHADTTFLTREIYVGRVWRERPYWFRYRSYDVIRDSYNGTAPLSFDREPGANANPAYLFVISSRYPLELGLLDSGHAGWIAVDLADDVYFRDPRQAVFDLARTIGVHGPNSVTFADKRSERQASNW